MLLNFIQQITRVLPASLLIYAFLGMLAAHSTESVSFKEGVHYQRVAQVAPQTSDTIEVTEFFWYGCPHCFALEVSLNEWLKNKPNDVTFVRVPAVFGGVWNIHARAYYAAELLNALDKIHTPLLNALNIQKRQLNTLEEVATFVAEQGVDKEEFIKTFNSFAVETRIKQAAQIARRYRLTGVPAVIVNGKYMTNGTMAGSTTQILAVVEHLVDKERTLKQSALHQQSISAPVVAQ